MAKRVNISNHVLEFIGANPLLSSKEIHEGLSVNTGYATVKRTLQNLIGKQLVIPEGKGKGTRYRISPSYELLYPINLEAYFIKEIDERKIRNSFNHALVPLLDTVDIFTSDELDRLHALHEKYTSNISKLSDSTYTKEMERLAIDLSWKSSQIEGNTYSLLETERLLKEKETAAGKTKDEAVMLLNHKTALDFIIENPTYLKPLTISGIEDIHSMLIKELNVARNIRRRRVGISGTNYVPPDNEFLLQEALERMCIFLNKEQNTYTRAFIGLTLLSYIQPFEDGNKRTARIISNAILISDKYCPLSFRTVDAIEYKKALLVFYEQNNISVFKKIFIQQAEFAVETYF